MVQSDVELTLSKSKKRGFRRILYWYTILFTCKRLPYLNVQHAVVITDEILDTGPVLLVRTTRRGNSTNIIYI